MSGTAGDGDECGKSVIGPAMSPSKRSDAPPFNLERDVDNKHPGKCYRCLQIVAPGQGFTHKNYGRWWVQHKACHDTGRRVYDADGDLVVEQVPISDPEYIALGKAAQIARAQTMAALSGEKGRKARKFLRERAPV